MDLNALFREDLRVHSGGALTYAIYEELARYLYETTSTADTTLETGAGLSTIIFALRGTNHITVTPSQDEVDRISEFCHERKISTQNIDFIVGASDIVLPNLKIPPLDLVLIDGGHGFPIPYIDWRYTMPHMNVGARVIIDDCQIDTGAVLRDFLRQETAWSEEKDFLGRTSVFRLNEPYQLKEWSRQPYTVKRSKKLRLASSMREAANLAMHGEFRKIYRSLRKRWLGGN